jgi:Tfp pilus assembly protein PilF
LICKDENDYLPEWLDYHILMGVDRFYIYDNESQVSLRETLKDYIERGWVVVLDIPGRAIQPYAYDHCLQTFGSQTFWMGFIDTDEFLVPKTSLDLKKLLKGYEAYGGLAVSSLFFGSNGHQTRPAQGQIAAYTRRTQATFKENELIKSIVQPGLALMPNSPHDFLFKEGAWCVNEGFLRVDGQRFPNYTEKIQLNHYFCRSASEIDLKLRRGRGAMDAAWPRKRFDGVNVLASCEDTSILQNLEVLFEQAGLHSEGLVGTMAALARARRPAPLEMTVPCAAQNFRAEFMDWMEVKDQGQLAQGLKDPKQVCQMLLTLIQLQPQYVHLYMDLASTYLNLNDPSLAWQALTRAWQLAPNTYDVLAGMSTYFLWTKDFSMVEKTSHLLLEIAPHNLRALSNLTEALIGQGRCEEALNVGLPVLELSARVGELPEGMGFYLVKQMGDYLLGNKDYTGAAYLWQAGAQSMPGEVLALLELTRCLLLAGDKDQARQALAQAQEHAPQHEAVLDLIRQVGAAAGPLRKRKQS